MTHILTKSSILFLLFVSIIACNPEEVNPLPGSYALQETSLYPESFVYSKTTEKIYVGSYYKGKIIAVDLLGNMTDFILDDSFVAVVGMAIDTKNNRLLVCNSDAGISQRSGPTTVGQLAKVLVFDLTTGEKLNTIDLSGLFPGGHFLNDLVLDDAGNIYVTDSFSPVIYKIDQNYNPSVLVTSPDFEVPPYAFGLNGIVYHPDNYLIVGKAFGGILYKIPLSDPANIQEISLNKSVNSLDGLLLTENNSLVLVSNNFTGEPFDETIYNIETSDDWRTASVTDSFTDLDGTFPTSVSMINNGLFVNFGYFPELIDPDSPPNDDFKLQKVTF